MSSSDPPQLRLSLPHSASTFKRSFDQFGFDLDTPLDPTTVASSSATDERRPGPSNADRNKRARSNSVTPNSAEQAHSMDSSPGSGSSHTISSTSSNHALADHRAPPAVAATRYPQTPGSDPVFHSGLGSELSHASSGLFGTPPLETPSAEPSTTSVWSNPLSSTNSSTNQNDQFRRSMERFHAFDSQISSIRARPSQLPFRVPSDPPTLPPLTPSSPVEHSHSHIGPAVSLPSVESLGHMSNSAQASASAPPLMALSSTTAPDQYRSDISPLRFEELGDLREMMGFYHERNPSSPNVDRPIVRRRHPSPPLPDNSERSHINPSFRRSPSRHMVENISRNPSMQSWPSDRRNAVPDDSDDDFYGPVVTMDGRESLDLPRSRLDSSLLANRIRRSMENQVTHPPLGRMSSPLFPTTDPLPVESNTTLPPNGSRTQELGRHNRHEPWSSHSSSRLPVFAEAFRTLSERLGRPRQRTSYASERRVERSRSPGAGTFSSSASAAHYAWPFGFSEFTPSEDSPYELDLPMPSPWFNEENATPRQSIPTSRAQGDTSISRQVPWRSSIPSNDTSEDRFLSYLSLLHRPLVTPSTETIQPDSEWRRLSSYTDYNSPHPPFTRTSSGRGGGANDAPSTRESHATEHNTFTLEVGPGWWRSVPRAEPSYGGVHERDTSSAPNPSLFGDRPPTERPSVSTRDFVSRHLTQPPSRIPPHDQSTRRSSSEVYQSVQPPEVGIMAPNTEAFRSDESSEVPFSSHAAALFASRATSSVPEISSQRRPDTVGFDRTAESSYYPWASRFERDLTFSAPRRHPDTEERRHRNSPEPERPSTNRRFAVAGHLASTAPASRPLDIEEFQHGPFRATLERRERQDQQVMMERQAEIDRLRSRLNELQSQERPTPSSRAPTLPPLRFDAEFVVSEAHRMPSPIPSANIETSSSFRADLDASHRRRSWQRGRGIRPSWLNSGDEPAQWRSSSGLASSTATLPMPRTHSPPPLPLPDSRNPHLAPELDRERRRRVGNLELWSPGDADDAMESLASSSAGDGSLVTRNLGRMRGEFQSTDGQQQQQARRETHGNPPWSMDPGRLALREPHADALRGIRPLWAAHPPVPWGMDARDEIATAGSNSGSSGDAPVRGRRRRVNQSALPPQGRNVSEDERAPGSRRTSSTSRYGSARRARDPVFDRFQRIVRGSPRDGGFFARYSRRNPSDFVRDEDFDASYESLLSLAATIGEVRPRHTPDTVINSLPTGTFKEWRNTESDQRCPICLDDYQEDDAVMRLSDCPHWLHKNCLQQWLRGATTCPVCRQRVRCPQSARRDRGARAEPQSGPSRATDRRGFDFAREIHEVRMAFPDINEAVSRSDVGLSGSRSEVEREIEIEQEVGDVVDMSLDWELAGAI